MTESTTKPSGNPIRRLYHWVLGWAETPYGLLAMLLVSFGDSSCFPIPPDPLLMALVLGNRKKAWKFAAACTVASVAGAAVGYVIGSSFWQAAEETHRTTLGEETLGQLLETRAFRAIPHNAKLPGNGELLKSL